MSDNQFRPGQKVRVSFEATVIKNDLLGRGWVAIDNPIVAPGVYAHAMHPDQLELIDDPASDPIGTVRLWEARPFIKTADHRYPWVDIARNGEAFRGHVTFPRANGNEIMRGTEILGMVPGFESDGAA